MIARFSVKKPFTVLVAVILVIILGVVAFLRMTPDLLPSISLPYVIVATSYVGASPEEVETAVTKPIEQSVATLDNIKTIQSTSSENYSVVILQFSDDVNMDAATMNIREKLDTLSEGWDDYVGTPVILKLNPNMIPQASVAVHYEGKSTLELSRFCEETLENRLEGVEGIASVTAGGLITEQVNVVVQQEKVDETNARIRAAVEKEFVDGETELSDAQTELDENLDEMEKAQKQIDQGRSAISGARADAKRQFDAARAAIDAVLNPLLEGLNALNTQKAAAEGQIASLNQQIADATAAGGDTAALQAQLSAAEGALAALNGQIDALNQNIAPVQAQRDALDAQEADVMNQLGGASGKLKSGQQELDAGKEQLDAAQEQLDAAQEQLDEAKQKALDATDLRNLLSLSTVGALLGAQNFSMPAGYAVDGDDAKWLVYVGDEVSTLDALSDLVLFDLGLDGLAPIRLSDVADVFKSDNTATTYAKLNGAGAVLLSFNKQSGYATAAVSDSLNEEFSALEAQYPGLSFETLMDQGEYINLVIDSVLENILLGAVLAVLILLLFLRDVRPTFVVACSIPISVTFAVVLMYFSGVTINIISLAGLAVGVGMLVDNSIVVIENIYRLRTLGASRYKAAISGTAQMAAAITSSTLTTVCVFLPLVFVEGLTKQLFADMALTIAYSLLASLAVAVTLVPAMAGGILRNVREEPAGKKRPMLAAYTGLLRFSLNNKGLAVVLSLLLLLVCGYASVNQGFSYLPDMASSQMMLQIELPEDATLEETAAVTDEIVARVLTLPEVKTAGAMLSSGLSSIVGLGGGAGGDNTTSTIVYLVLNEPKSYLGYVPKANRQRDSIALSPLIEDMCADLPCTVSASGAGNMAEYLSAFGGSGVTVNLYGNDLDALMESARAVAARLTTVEGLGAVDDGVQNTTPALRVTVDKEKAIQQGLTTAQVYQDVAAALTESASVTELSGTGSDIVLRMQPDSPRLDALKAHEITVKQTDGTYKQVKLSDIATFTESETLRSIGRSGQRRYVTVTAALLPDYNITLVSAEAEKALSGVALSSGVSMELSGENETIMSALKDLLLMLLLGVVIVYLIMVAQFQSLLSPLIVMVTIPLAFTGGFIALLLFGMDVSIVAMIGFIMLVGIIVNNGIVLIDTMNQLRLSGMGLREAVIEAGRTRLRPVLMTALTTILGLVPLSLGLGMGGGLVQPVAVVCIGGLVYATFMTLFVVPILYELLVKKPPRSISKEDLELTDE